MCLRVSVRIVLSVVVAFVLVASLLTGSDTTAALSAGSDIGFGEQVEISNGDIQSNALTWQQPSLQAGTGSASFTQVSAGSQAFVWGAV